MIKTTKHQTVYLFLKLSLYVFENNVFSASTS